MKTKQQKAIANLHENLQIYKCVKHENSIKNKFAQSKNYIYLCTRF
jgi:lantibiotic modifying enzyme